ncbi:Cell division protein FtsA [BD1-7 clade bacterium]|uniref:Cell division protein FtsA n=1 Tax=BD1-7 clade bacterium TaxID=2029982 RepID=A0A5S9QXX2_9GAMM|nr:Cell division protein FtsA [BD1-7 clade bacterium]
MKNTLSVINLRLQTAMAIVNDETPIQVQGDWYLGIDLGTADIQTMAVDSAGIPIACFLDWADVVKDGVVVDYVGACDIVAEQIKKVEKRLGTHVTRAVTSYPPGTDPKISTNVVESCGLEIVAVVDEPSSVAHLLGINDGAVVDVGGGTTGSAIIHHGAVVVSLDDPTGGRHITLTLSGAKNISVDDAEIMKRDHECANQVLPVVRPVIEKMADLVKAHLSGADVDDIYLTGGSCSLRGFQSVFQDEFPDQNVILPDYPIFLTPLAIASYALISAGVNPAVYSQQEIPGIGYADGEGRHVNH